MRIFIHPIFLIVVAVAIFFSTTHFLLALFIAVLLHEFAHIFVARQFGIIVSKLTITPFGGAVDLQTKFLPKQQRSIILLAGPVASLLLTLLFGVLVWLFPVFFIHFEVLVAANFMVGFLNMMPIYPLDGGKVIAQYVNSKWVCLWSNLFFVFMLLTAIIKFNFWLILLSVMMLIQINWEYRQAIFHDKFTHYGQPKIGEFVCCAVRSTTTLWEAYRLVNKKSPTKFVLTDYQNKSFYESNLEQWLISYPLNTQLSKCLSLFKT